MEAWLVGMQLALLGCFCSAVGLVLLKHSTNAEGGLPCQRKKFFWIGFIFLIVNASVIDVFAFSLAPITLIAPFTGVTIVFTSWLASSGVLFVKETLDVEVVMARRERITNEGKDKMSKIDNADELDD